MPELDAWVWIAIAGAAFLILAVLIGIGIAAALMRRRKTTRLQERFGPEYEQTTAKVGNRRRAEAELEAREKRVGEFDIHPLSPEDRARFAEAWQGLQQRFVDEPVVAVTSADQLIVEVMQARGYPVGNFEQQAADVSVNHPHVVEFYRRARAASVGSSNGHVSTEDLRQAMQHYRNIFEDLLLERDRQQQEEQTVSS